VSHPFHSRFVIVAALLGTAVFDSSPARAQNSAEWLGTRPNGLWSQPFNWGCSFNNGPLTACVPGAGFSVSLLEDADVHLDLNESVSQVAGDASTKLTLDAGQTLAATGIAGVNVGVLTLNSGSVLTTTVAGASNFLLSDGATLTASGFISSPIQTDIHNSTLSSLSAIGEFAISGSVVNNLAAQSFSSLTSVSSNINTATGANEILASTVHAAISVDQGTTVLIDQGSTISTPTALTPQSVSVLSGTMTLTGGSKMTVNLAPASVGNSFTGAGFLNVNGANTLMTLNGVGFNVAAGLADATLTVQNGGTINGQGNSPLAVGSLFTGTSRVSVLGGGAIAVSDVVIFGTPTTSIVTVSDPTSTLTAADNLRLTGGTLDVKNNGQASASFIDIQQGQVTVETNGTLSSAGPLLVGFNGSGALSVLSGGQVSSDVGVIARKAGSTGAVTVSSAGSQWSTVGDMTVGMVGTGTLDVNAGGTVSSGSGIVGDQASSNGKVTVQGLGSAWQVGGSLTIANQQGSIGELDVQSQGLVTVRNAAATIGNGPGTLGTVNVSSGGRWTIDQGLTVGNQGTGQLTIGGINARVDSLDGTIASLAGSNGAVSLQIGAQWSTTNGVVVAGAGSGQLSVDLGARAIVGGGVDIAKLGGSIGTLTVDGTLNVRGDLSVGKGGTGQMTIEGGGNVAAAGGHIGQAPGAIGTANITGSNPQGPSTWGLANQLLIAEGGTGTLNITDGGLVQSHGAQVGGLADSVGTVTISGAGSMWEDSATVGIGGLGGRGTVNVTDGGTLRAATVVVGTLGKLGGDMGSIVATVVNTGGIVRPGDAPGVLHITGDYQQTAGTLLFEIDGDQPGQFDQLLVSGHATLSGGLVEIEFMNGFVPNAGDRFDLLASAGLDHAGVDLEVMGLAAGVGYTTAFDATGLELTVAGVPAVPEPSTWLLFGTGLAAIGRRRAILEALRSHGI
jgi:T5SS/PEP-CTERM-associated repeat protein